jgi:hypothetical protein
METPAYGWRFSLRCTRCTTERHDVIARSGHVNGRRYIYPDGYQYAKGERPSRDELRNDLYSRLRAKLAKSHAIGDLENGEELRSA